MMNQAKALAILKSGKNVFLTGSAGAGKTYVLNLYIQYLKERKVPVAVTASTGIAATHMNGMTIHSWSGIGVKDEIDLKDLQNLKLKKYISDKLKIVQVLIIDEISMLHRKQFEMVNKVLQYFKENSLAFGGIQVVVSGDFFQLPPVGAFGEQNRDKFAFMADSWLKAEFCVCYISEQHRQEDNELNAILNQIRTGEVEEHTVNKLQSNRDKELISEFITRLYTHNVDVDRLNNEYLEQLQTDRKVFKAVLKGNEKLREALKKSVLTEERLELKPGTKVMFIKNNYEQGYMNGTLGVVLEFSEEGFPLVKTNSGRIIEAEPEDWTIQDEKGKVLASFNQVPLRLAWAITIHKSQGMTLDAAEMDLSKTFERGQGYVALSRLKDLEHLHLTGFNAMALQVDPLALKADRRFMELSVHADNKWTVEELERRHELFLKMCGGLTDAVEIENRKLKSKFKKEKKSTYEQTEEMIKKGYDIQKIARERGFSESTVLNHLIRIKDTNPKLNLDRFKPDEFILMEISRAVKAIREEKTEEWNGKSVAPIFNHLKGEFSYNQIRQALLFIHD